MMTPEEQYKHVALFGVLGAVRLGAFGSRTVLESATAGGIYEGTIDLSTGVITEGSQKANMTAALITAPMSMTAGEVKLIPLEVPTPMEGTILKTIEYSSPSGSPAITGVWLDKAKTKPMVFEVTPFPDVIWVEIKNSGTAYTGVQGTVRYGGTAIVYS